MAGALHPEDDAPPRWADEVLEPALRAPGVTWLPQVDLAAKRRLFAGARALVAPVRWEEPFGLVMIEALLAGCPVIVPERGAAPEIVEHGRNGFLAGGVEDIAEALRAASALDRAAIQADARRRFSAARMAEEYTAAYELAAGGTVGAGAGEAEWTTARE